MKCTKTIAGLQLSPKEDLGRKKSWNQVWVRDPQNSWCSILLKKVKYINLGSRDNLVNTGNSGYVFVKLELNSVIVMNYKEDSGLDARAAGSSHSGPRS